jgi:hypothetical protein
MLDTLQTRLLGRGSWAALTVVCLQSAPEAHLDYC